MAVSWPDPVPARATGAGTASERGQLVGQVVRVVLLVRLASLVAAVGWLVGEKLSPQLFVAIVLLSGFSFVGLTQPAFLDQMIRHPMLAMTDVALVVVVFVVLGVESPLALAALSTSLLIGLLYPPGMALLLAGVLGLTFAGQALIEASRSADGNQFLPLVGLPVTFCCLVWVGHTVVQSNTAQMQAESRLAELIQASAAADERSRLAREMHDSLAKSLQGLAFGAAALPTWVEQDGDRARTEATALAADAQEAVMQARTLMTRMRNDAPLRPFDEVLADVLEAWEQQHGNPVELRLSPVQSLAPDARYELMAVLRESLENITRHARGAAVCVTLDERDQGVALEIRDAGAGFDPSRIAEREADGHFGLRGMYERMGTVSGRTEVRSAPGRGTVLRFWVPKSDPHLLPRQ